MNLDPIYFMNFIFAMLCQTPEIQQKSIYAIPDQINKVNQTIFHIHHYTLIYLNTLKKINFYNNHHNNNNMGHIISSSYLLIQHFFV